MANDDEFNLGGRKNSRQGTPRTGKSGSGQGSNGGGIKLAPFPGGNFTKRMARDFSIAKSSSGRQSYTKPSKPRTGRFNARGRGRTALAAGIGPNRSWQTLRGDSSGSPVVCVAKTACN